jgi:hypothetical protein
MTSPNYARDTQATTLELVRIALWARQGAKIVDFPYLQPVYALSPRAGAGSGDTGSETLGPGTQALRIIGAPPHLRLRLNDLKTYPQAFGLAEPRALTLRTSPDSGCGTGRKPAAKVMDKVSYKLRLY